MALPSLTQPNLCIFWLLSLVEDLQGISAEGHALQPFSDSFILSGGREGRQFAISVFGLWDCHLHIHPWAEPLLCILPVWYLEALGPSCIPTMHKIVIFICQVEGPFYFRKKLKVGPQLWVQQTGPDFFSLLGFETHGADWEMVWVGLGEAGRMMRHMVTGCSRASRDYVPADTGCDCWPGMKTSCVTLCLSGTIKVHFPAGGITPWSASRRGWKGKSACAVEWPSHGSDGRSVPETIQARLDCFDLA